EMLNFVNQNKIPPVIQINGTKIQKAAGIDTNSLSIAEMIVEVIKDQKQIYFGDAYSAEPYIVFFEEADEMGDVITKKEGNYLKDIKD
ncbi:4794_t:CDS:1, partial [Ambispora gerdemannii]